MKLLLYVFVRECVGIFLYELFISGLGIFSPLADIVFGRSVYQRTFDIFSLMGYGILIIDNDKDVLQKR